MRIAILDNTANGPYIQAKAMRRRGYDVDLILDPTDRFVMSDPRWEDLDLELPTDRLRRESLPAEAGLPSWVRDTRTSRRPSRVRQLVSLSRHPAAALTAWRLGRIGGLRIAGTYARIIGLLQRYDCVISYGTGHAIAGLAGVPFLAQTYGSDITLVPFQDLEGSATSVDRALARLQRRGLGRAYRILMTDPRFFPSAERLGLRERSEFVPFVWDTEKYSPGSEPELRSALLGSGDQLVFVASRQDWYWKGSDAMIRGFALAQRHHPGAVLACAGWGDDLERSKALVAELGISASVRFLPFAASKGRLLRYYRAADIVMDQVVVGSYGGSALEAMSCARPVVIHLDVERFREVLDEFPPVANARTPDEVAIQLERLLSDSLLRQELGASARRWVERHHGPHLADHVYELCRKAAGAGTE